MRRHKQKQGAGAGRDTTIITTTTAGKAERVVIEDERMNEEKNERMGIVQGPGRVEMVSSGSEGGWGLPIPHRE